MAGKGSPPGIRQGGRQKGTKNKIAADVRVLAQVYGPAAVKTLATIMADKKAQMASRVAASKELLDRGYGKSVQPLEAGPGGLIIHVTTGVPDARA